VAIYAARGAEFAESAWPPIHAGSLTMASVGSAVLTACNALRDSFVRTAVVDPPPPVPRHSTHDVSVRDGSLFLTSTPQRSETYQEILRRHKRPQHGQPTKLDTGRHAPALLRIRIRRGVRRSLGRRTTRPRPHPAAVRHLRRRTSDQPKLAHSQALGGMVAGIGMALLEGTHIDHRDGRIVNANMADYLVPVNADSPT
jgi:xanthine dehydrogenase YagR molybdenum-binding subunit